MSFDLKKFDPQDADDFIELALEGLSVIASLVGGNIGDKATEALAGIKAIVDAIFSGYNGKVTFEEARNELKKFTESLAANDARADRALAHKFAKNGKTGPKPASEPDTGSAVKADLAKKKD